MTTLPNTNTPADYVTCPKCFGAKTFSVWSHIAGGACFACGYGVQPDQRRRRGLLIVKPEALAHMLKVRGLTTRAPPQAHGDERQREGDQQTVEVSHAALLHLLH